jgi:hypothetical protein
MTEFLAKWIAAAFLLAFAWAGRRSRRRAGWTFTLTLALLGFEIGVLESVLEMLAAGVLAVEALAKGRARGRVVRVGALAAAAALVWFSLRPLPALLGISSLS